jgi:hypothetical protein
LETSTEDKYIRIVIYADDLVILAEKETVLQGMIDTLTETGRCCGMEMWKKPR